MLNLILIRGLPGSGKSTLARSIAQQYEYSHFETDMFFERGGEYFFDQRKLGQAIKWCNNRVEQSLQCRTSAVVTGVFTKLSQIDPYREMAAKHNARLIVIDCEGEYDSIHDVPEEAISRMRAQFEHDASFFKHDNEARTQRFLEDLQTFVVPAILV